MIYSPNNVKIPADWSITRADAILNHINNPIRSQSLKDGIFFHYSIPAIQDTGDGKIEDGIDIDSDKLLLEGGEILISKLNPEKGCVIIAESHEIPTICSTELVPLRVKSASSVNSKYVFYVYSSNSTRDLLASRSESATRSHKRVNPSEIAKLKFPLPPLNTQNQIANYLDRETSHIDALIQAKENLLTMLTEKRQALITNAVTCGLDPNVPLKPSGVDWLGNIPEHWEVERTRWLFKERNERSETGEEEMLTVSHITGVTSRSEKDVNMFEAESNEGYKICFPGDLVINTLWAWMGAMGISPLHGIVSPAYHVYIPLSRIEPAYIDTIVRLPIFASEVTRYSKGVWSSRLRLYPEGLYEVYLPVPPLEEQRQIVDHIKVELNKINKFQSAAEQSITLLKERRSALITAAVTGQIEIPV
ncbi:restriction endonuclease subunit S [Spirosoma sp. KCTC 42546]|uniref:restriction endonuclease subunit S n=1 Tax=Spirosoma sp. KCTC 42546 TaxID=2520506 RepID=UPI0011578EE2|nr:restriction endonuclease subunit S [Spirosoma sp. KCTC 42546]QDK81268.1 restriction endonuclease subunit S [Spirosoma sp. KCTC 42546]